MTDDSSTETTETETGEPEAVQAPPPTNAGTVTIGDVPGYTYTIVRGTPEGESGYPSNWHTLIVSDPDGAEVQRLGFAGP